MVVIIVHGNQDAHDRTTQFCGSLSVPPKSLHRIKNEHVSPGTNDLLARSSAKRFARHNLEVRFLAQDPSDRFSQQAITAKDEHLRLMVHYRPSALVNYYRCFNV